MTEPTPCLTGDLRTPGKRRAQRARLARLATATADIIPSPNYSSRNGTTVTGVCIHTAEGPTDATALGNYFAQSSVQVSSHDGADDTKRVHYVDYQYEAWTLRNGNSWSDNLEMCGFASWTRDQWLQHPGMIQQAASWVAERCHARNVPPVRLTPADIKAGRRSGYFAHWDYTLGTGDGTHWDVGTSFPWDIFGGLVQAAYNGTEDDMTPDESAALKEVQMIVRELRWVQPPFVGSPTHLTDAVGDIFQNARKAAANVDPAALAAAVVAALPSSSGALSEADVETALRKVLGSLDNPAA